MKKKQKDYTMPFKLGVVHEVKRGEIGICEAARKYGIQSHKTVTTWLRKYGNFDWENRPLNKPKKKQRPSNPRAGSTNPVVGKAKHAVGK